MPVSHRNDTVVTVRTVDLQANKLHKISRGMIIMLFIQYVAGMTIAAFGSENPADRTLAANIAFPIHILVAVGLLVNAIRFFIAVRNSTNEPLKKAAIYGLISIIVAFGGGIATLAHKGINAEISSYIMSLGYIAAFAIYLYLYFIHRGESPIVKETKKNS